MVLFSGVTRLSCSSHSRQAGWLLTSGIVASPSKMSPLAFKGESDDSERSRENIWIVPNSNSSAVRLMC